MAHVDVELPEQQHTFHLEAGKHGWWYGLPNPKGGRFVVFCSRTDAFSPKHIRSRNTFIELLAQVRLFGESLAPGLRAIRLIGRPAGPRSYEQVAGNRWVAVGDAAFVSDPLSGMGIEFAVESAKLAAEALCAASRDLALTEYAQAVKEYAARQTKVGAFHRARADPLSLVLPVVRKSAGRTTTTIRTKKDGSR
jgi:flavin-dependent dehydrogenase